MEVEEFLEIEKATSLLYLNEIKRLVLLLDFQLIPSSSNGKEQV